MSLLLEIAQDLLLLQDLGGEGLQGLHFLFVDVEILDVVVDHLDIRIQLLDIFFDLENHFLDLLFVWSEVLLDLVVDEGVLNHLTLIEVHEGLFKPGRAPRNTLP